MIQTVTCRSKVLIIFFALLPLVPGQIYPIEQSETRAVNSASGSNDGLEQDLCNALAYLRNSLRIASDYSVMLTDGKDLLTVVDAIGDATESLEQVRQIVRELLGRCN